MVKTAEELKEYQRLYYQKNKQKINQRQKEYLHEVHSLGNIIEFDN